MSGRIAAAISGLMFLTACQGSTTPHPLANTSPIQIAPSPTSTPTPSATPFPIPSFTDLPPSDQWNPNPTPSPGSSSGSGSTSVPYPKSMASLGDSITAGFIANLKRGDWLNPDQVKDLVSALYDIEVRGSDAVNRLEQRELSWSGGLDGDVRSHAYRIKKKTGKIRVYNAAITGAEAKDVLDDELDKILSWARKELGQPAPDYVTLMIGPNDICAEKVSKMTSVADYSDRIDRIVKTLLDAYTGTRVLVNTIPAVDTLRNALKDARAIAFGYSCSDLWKDTGLCPTLTTDDHDDDRKQISQRLKDYNAALATIVTRYKNIYGDRVRLATKVYETSFDKDDMSVDCFHPNPRGQNKIADASWKSSWWNF